MTLDQARVSQIQQKKKTLSDFLKNKNLGKGHHQASEERQHTELEKVFANHVSNKGLVFRIS